MDTSKPTAKHLPRLANRRTKISLSAGAAIRLLLFTGCRLREILNLKWEYVDLERGVLFLPDSKSGRKTVVLNAPAMTVLNGLERIGPFVVPGDTPGNPRSDLKRPWESITVRAGHGQTPKSAPLSHAHFNDHLAASTAAAIATSFRRSHMRAGSASGPSIPH